MTLKLPNCSRPIPFISWSSKNIITKQLPNAFSNFTSEQIYVVSGLETKVELMDTKSNVGMLIRNQDYASHDA